jgi:hypothetical protein
MKFRTLHPSWGELTHFDELPMLRRFGGVSGAGASRCAVFASWGGEREPQPKS